MAEIVRTFVTVRGMMGDGFRVLDGAASEITVAHLLPALRRLDGESLEGRLAVVSGRLSAAAAAALVARLRYTTILVSEPASNGYAVITNAFNDSFRPGEIISYGQVSESVPVETT